MTLDIQNIEGNIISYRNELSYLFNLNLLNLIYGFSFR